MKQITDQTVYFVTQQNYSGGLSTTDVVRGAIEGGVDVVQLREKHMSARERYELGLKLRRITEEAEVPLIVDDRVDIAAAIDADGVHVGDSDLPIEVAREQLGKDAIIGRSVTTPEEARAAVAAGADYLGVGAVYHTDSKDVDPEEEGIGPEGVTAVREAVDIPIVGIGGIDAGNAADVVAAGAEGVAVISAIATAENPKEATIRLSDAVMTGVNRR